MLKAAPDLIIMAFDFGTKRIGVAVGNTITRLGQPISTIAEPSSDAYFHKTFMGDPFCQEWKRG